MAKIEQSTDIIPVIEDTKDIKSLIYVVRGQQVMLDSDLAMLYQVETKVFNQAVSRNIERFAVCARRRSQMRFGTAAVRSTTAARF